MTDRTIFRLNPAKNPFLGNLPEEAMDGFHFCLETDSFEASVAELQQQGVPTPAARSTAASCS